MSENGSGRERSERLRSSVSRLRSKGGGPSMERWLMIVGAGLIIIGVPVIVLGWYGASHTPYVFEQVPYLISGGVLGLALAVVGGLFYFAYWITRQMQETRRQADQTREALSEIRDLLADRVIASAGKRQASSNGGFVATEKGTMFHRPDCVVVAGREDLHEVTPDGAGLEPCKICEPLSVS
ncbi:MAG: hypothetical protein WAT66_16610 [Actinomycetota bacterium]